jgi:hypothetical protein
MVLDASKNLHVDGDIVAYSTSVSSDYRLKKNITPISGALDKVNSLRGVMFDWKSGHLAGEHDVGVIAQEVEEIIPEVVKIRKRPDRDIAYKTVDYAKLVPVLIESIKELSAKVESIEAQLK